VFALQLLKTNNTRLTLCSAIAVDTVGVKLNQMALLSTRGGLQRSFVPQEISDYTLSFVQTEIECLKQCSLVCRSWLYASREYLFRSIEINHANADEFARVVGNPSSTLPSYVQKIRLNPRSSLDYRWFQRLVPVISRLALVTSLVLERIDWMGVNIRTRASFLAHFAGSLTKLELKDIAFDAFADFQDLVCEFTELHALVVHNVTWENRPTFKPLTNTHPTGHPTHHAKAPKTLSPRLTQLVLSHCPDNRQILLWLLSQPSALIHTVTSLQITPIRERDMVQFGRYIRTLGPHLLHLHISFAIAEITPACFGDQHLYPSLPTPPVPPHLDEQHLAELVAADARWWELEKGIIKEEGLSVCENLVALTSLRTLRIDHFLTRNAEGESRSEVTRRVPSNAVMWAPKVLMSIKSPYLTRITLDVCVARTGEVDMHSIKWKYLDRILTQGRKETVKEIVISYSGGVKGDAVRDLISSRWPTCASKGILRFVPANCL